MYRYRASRTDCTQSTQTETRYRHPADIRLRVLSIATHSRTVSMHATCEANHRRTNEAQAGGGLCFADVFFIYFVKYRWNFASIVL